MSITIKQAINEFLLNCKVEGKSYGTIECYSDKLKGFLCMPPIRTGLIDIARQLVVMMRWRLIRGIHQ